MLLGRGVAASADATGSPSDQLVAVKVAPLGEGELEREHRVLSQLARARARGFCRPLHFGRQQIPGVDELCESELAISEVPRSPVSELARSELARSELAIAQPEVRESEVLVMELLGPSIDALWWASSGGKRTRFPHLSHPHSSHISPILTNYYWCSRGLFLTPHPPFSHTLKAPPSRSSALCGFALFVSHTPPPFLPYSEGTTLSVVCTLRLALGALLALRELHAIGQVHNDVTPGNPPSPATAPPPTTLTLP